MQEYRVEIQSLQAGGEERRGRKGEATHHIKFVLRAENLYLGTKSEVWHGRIDLGATSGVLSGFKTLSTASPAGAESRVFWGHLGEAVG
jgi:hypothetical protein